MEPNVLLTIEGQQWNDDDKPQAIKLTTEGRLYRRDPAWYIVYQESPATGMEGDLPGRQPPHHPHGNTLRRPRR
jgi:uncharacterized beta-barrel protein YwiB (DUF1934 family)